ncbi:MAG: type II secretion system minor pseudopilin GspH [Gammaproteobacteria bacterium]
MWVIGASRPGDNTPLGIFRQQAGFTLLELMVVILIIGVMGVAIAMNVHRRDTRLDDEVERLRAVLELASQTAIISSAELGFAVTENGYRFYELNGDGWVALAPKEGPLRTHEIANGMVLSLRTDSVGGESVGATDLPELLLRSSGEYTPFELEVFQAQTGERAVIEGYGAGRIRVQMPTHAL